MVASPPASGGRGAWMWLSAAVVSSAGAESASAVVNPTDSEIGYGAQWVAERWDGREWVRGGSQGDLDRRITGGIAGGSCHRSRSERALT